MNYLDKEKLHLEIEHALFNMNGVVSVYYFLNKYFIYTERYDETELMIRQIFQNIISNFNISFEIIRALSETSVPISSIGGVFISSP